jgi:hypothetical protein
MIWHIFKKDWKLQWKFAVIMTLVQFANAALLVKLGPFQDNRSLNSLVPLMILAILAGIPFLIAAVVHQDAIPGVRQDWLVRPIRRRDFLLAKLLFVLIAVHGPMLLADLFRGLANGFAFGPSLAAAGSHGLFVLVAFSVPLFAFASLTRNFMEAIVAGLIVFLCFVGFLFLADQTVSRHSLVASTGLSWIPETAQYLVALAAAAAVLSLQYFRRRTITARGLAAGAVALGLLCAFLPWNAAFAIEQRMSPNPGAASAVTVSFDPQLGRGHRVISLGAVTGAVGIYLPLRFKNLPADSALITDRTEVSLRDSNGTSTNVGSGELSIRKETGEEGPPTHLEVFVPEDVFQRLQDQPGQLEINLWLTLFRGTGLHTIPALGGRASIPDFGKCLTKVNASETGVRLGCVPLKEAPSCFWGRLQHVPSGRSNPPQFQCNGDYSPYFDELLVMPPPGRNLQFRDLSGLAKFPVDGSQLGESQVVGEAYEPVDHFARTVVIPSTRLHDWTGE